MMSRLFQNRAVLLSVSILSVSLALPSLGCGPSSGSAKSQKLDLVEIQNGFGLLLPHQVKLASAPDPNTAPVIKILSESDLESNVSTTNPILPVSVWPTTAILPSGQEGNHFIAIKFTTKLKMSSILDGTSSSPNYGLTDAVRIYTVNYSNPLNPQTEAVPGRAFINGYTGVSGNLTQVVRLNAAGQPSATTGSVGVGFPTGFTGADKLVSDNTLVFVADSDGNLNTKETFPTGIQIRVEVHDGTDGVTADNGKKLLREAVVCSTVGSDTYAAEIQIITDTDTGLLVPDITPGNNDTDVDPTTALIVRGYEPMQPFWFGSFFKANAAPGTSPSVTVTAGQQANPTLINFPITVRPENGNVFNLTSYELTPSVNLPADSPLSVPNSIPLNFVRVAIAAGTGSGPTQANPRVGDLICKTGTGVPGVNAVPNNPNIQNHQITFETGVGPGLVNAPIAPEVIYIGRNGSEGGVSVIDLNGYGQSTGDPTNNFDNVLDSTDVSKSYFHIFRALNQGGGIVPPFIPGNTTLDGGSAGVFTLTKDTNLSDQLFTDVGTITDMHIGHALDKVFNNSPVPYGGACSAQGNFCARDNLQNAQGNPIDLRPRVNPPRLELNPSVNCLSPQILGQDPVSASPAGMVIGDAFGTVGGNPPSGILYTPTNTGVGPQPPAQNPASCAAYDIRQQIGHFLYVVDNTNKKLLVLNSNRMSLVDSINLPDPTRIGFAANLSIIGVTNFSTNTVSFIGVDPWSANFHQIIAEVAVGEGPLGIAFQPNGEDIFVCNNVGNSVTIIRQSDLTVRKTINSQITRPIDCYLSERNQSGLYDAYILNGNGTVTMFESGPSEGPQAYGFDAVIGVVATNYNQATHITSGYTNQGDPWVLHKTPDGQPAVSHLTLLSAPGGQQTLNPGQGNTNFFTPGFRNKVYGTSESIPAAELSGVSPTDLAYDDLLNNGGNASNGSGFSTVTPATQNGKDFSATAGTPSMIFVAFFDVGKVDVIQRSTLRRYLPSASPSGAGQQGFKGYITAPGVSVLTNYWRQ